MILCIINGSSQPISLSFMVLKTCKIQRENILKRPIGSVIQENYNFDSTSPQLPFHINSFRICILFFKIRRYLFSIIILDFVTLGFPILFSSDNKTLRPSKPPRLKLNSKCFSANPLSPILVTVCLDAYDLDFPLTFVFAVSSNLESQYWLSHP